MTPNPQICIELENSNSLCGLPFLLLKLVNGGKEHLMGILCNVSYQDTTWIQGTTNQFKPTRMLFIVYHKILVNSYYLPEMYLVL